MSTRRLANRDVVEITAEIPEGHRHVRTTVRLADGSALEFQEAATAALVRAFLGVKTHPTRNRVCLRGRPVPGRKPGYAEWQLLEEDPE